VDKIRKNHLLTHSLQDTKQKDKRHLGDKAQRQFKDKKKNRQQRFQRLKSTDDVHFHQQHHGLKHQRQQQNFIALLLQPVSSTVVRPVTKCLHPVDLFFSHPFFQQGPSFFDAR
jgi:hypothetical protein